MVQQGPGSIVAWGTRWIYWKSGVFRVIPPASLETLRLAYKYRRRNKKYGIRDPILVYQMGKVGSSSVYRSLQALDLDVPVYQIHFLNYLDEYEQWAKRAFRDNPKGLELFHLGRDIRQRMDRDPRQRWNLISLVRAPIPRAISSFFQNIEANFPRFHDRMTRQDLTAHELAEFFVCQFDERLPLNWFERQVSDVFGIDVYATDFPRDRGYQIYEKDNVRMLLLRLEDLSRCAGQAMQEFLRIPNFVLSVQNVTDNKQYASLYRDFTQTLRLRPENLELWHNSHYAKHFYSDVELAESVKHWI